MWDIASKLTQKLPAEMAHNVAVKALSWGLGPRQNVPVMPVRFQGLSCDNPLGLAAGFDKNAEAYKGAFGLGFGLVEVGTITPLAQPGNPRPRVFRLPEDEAVINRYGFNGKGMGYAASRLAKHRRQDGRLLGVNIGANKLTQDKPSDYHKTAAYLASYADYITVNISSPNTPGLRDLQDADGLARTLQATFDGLSDAQVTVPVFVKLAPDLSQTALVQSLEAAAAFAISGVILTNTTITRPDSLTSPHQAQSGGLSGRPVSRLSEQALYHAASWRAAHQSDMALISVGGIFDARDIYKRLLLGAQATQLYSALSLQGPQLVQHCLSGLKKMLDVKAGGLWQEDNLSLYEPSLSVEKATEQADTLYESAMVESADKAR